MPVVKAVYRSHEVVTVKEFESRTLARISLINEVDRPFPHYGLKEGDKISIIVDSIY